MFAIVRTIVPDNFFGAGPPLKPGTLLPVPRRGFSYLDPLEAILRIDNADVRPVRGLNKTILKVHLHRQEIASGSIELKALIKEESRVGRPAAVLRIGDPDQRGIPRAVSLQHFLEGP